MTAVCISKKKLKHHSFIYLRLNVDHMLITCKSKNEIGNLKNMLKSEFVMKDLGVC